jgi:hypothetical protein
MSIRQEEGKHEAQPAQKLVQRQKELFQQWQTVERL